MPRLPEYRCPPQQVLSAMTCACMCIGGRSLPPSSPWAWRASSGAGPGDHDLRHRRIQLLPCSHRSSPRPHPLIVLSMTAPPPDRHRRQPGHRTTQYLRHPRPRRIHQAPRMCPVAQALATGASAKPTPRNWHWIYLRWWARNYPNVMAHAPMHWEQRWVDGKSHRGPLQEHPGHRR